MTLSSLSSPLLSLCIPTFNRAALLREALGAVLDQGDAAFFEAVEVLVFDNASADETEETVAAFQFQHPEMLLRYFRQPVNLGGDGNMLSLVQQASGEFVWILSDDDLLLPGALEKLFALVHAHPSAAAFCLNAKAFRQTPTEAAPPYFSLPADREFTDPDETLLFFETMITFMSLLVFRRSLIAGRDYTGKIGTYLITSYLFLDIIAEKQGIVVTHQPFLALRADNSGGFQFFKVFVTNFDRLIGEAVRHGYSRKAMKRLMAGHLRRCLFQHTLTFKVRGAIGTLRPNWGDAARRLLRVYGPHPFVVLVLLPLIAVPLPVLNAARFAYRRLKGLRRGAAPAESSLAA